MMKKFILSYSCGKDSTLALYRLIKRGLKPVGLIVTVNKDENESWFHRIPESILDEVSSSLDIPLIKVVCSGEQYEDYFEEALKKGKELGAEMCAFGDIDIESHRGWCTDRCNNVSIDAEFPLWQEDREELTHEFIEAGFKGIIKCCNDTQLNDTYLGKVLTKEVVSDIKETGADPCGENGEYHTFVCGGPIFEKDIKFKLGEKLKINNYNHIVIEK
ncbi:diphthine--ammonia ligase [Clostridium sardiniense]|uniref:Diphthine--ammonia ligase n=1 Tax=Clostridium sardiniense TaxID=29369 RepID=A0ABS7KXR9_CLOSR|nr:diphthine--ammonia ligase [Clostridium sardiniense]MBY0755609.1 diphthine--ammonia ligase [Clostridium sardiniense]